MTLACSQIESFIPLWEWDYPKKKKSRKGKDGDGEGSSKSKGKGKARAGDDKADEPQNGNGEATIEEVVSSGDSRPVSRNARVEDAPDDE